MKALRIVNAAGAGRENIGAHPTSGPRHSVSAETTQSRSSTINDRAIVDRTYWEAPDAAGAATRSACTLKTDDEEPDFETSVNKPFADPTTLSFPADNFVSACHVDDNFVRR